MKITIHSLIFILITTVGFAQDRIKTIHVFVALCDNENQGIVPVPKKLGNGEDPNNNLYWGALYGTKAFLKRSDDWYLVNTTRHLTHNVLERVVYRHKNIGAYLVADAYRGAKIKNTVIDFLNAAAGNNPRTLTIGRDNIDMHGGADLIVYVGHNGLMDFNVKETKQQKDIKAKDAIVLACKSKPDFQSRLSKLGCRSVLLTTGFMAPEAYTLKASVDGWLSGESGAQIKERAARSYNRYQKCGLSASRRLFYSEE